MQTKIIIAMRYDISKEDPKDWAPYALGIVRNGNQKGWFYLDEDHMACTREDFAMQFDSFADAAAQVVGIEECPGEWELIGVEFIQIEVEVEE